MIAPLSHSITYSEQNEYKKSFSQSFNSFSKLLQDSLFLAKGSICAFGFIPMSERRRRLRWRLHWETIALGNDEKKQNGDIEKKIKGLKRFFDFRVSFSPFFILFVFVLNFFSFFFSHFFVIPVPTLYIQVLKKNH